MTDAILETEDLTKSFGALVANDQISLTVEAGDIHGIIGPNGSGKTTFFNTVTGLYTANSGHIRFDGTEITNWKPHKIARRGLGRTFQIPAPFEEMTVQDNLVAVNTGESLDEKRDRAREILELLEIDHLADDPSSDMSGGQQKLLELARVLMLDPDCILLDEPTAGVNPALADRILDHIRSLNEDGVTFLVIEHDMSVMSELADVVTVFDNGQIITEGSFESVTNNSRVMEAYLGSELEDDSILEFIQGEEEASTGSDSIHGEKSDDGETLPTLKGNDIVSGYGQHQVLNGVTFESRGGITGIFGPNGSGKSTLLKSLNGQLSVWSGSVTYNREPITNTPPEDLVKTGITTLQQDSGVFERLSVEDNLRIGSYHVDDKSVVEDRLNLVFDTFPALEERRSVKAKSLSGGQRMMVSFGRAMMTGADTYLLDEPSAGLAPALVDDVFDMVEKLEEEGGDVVLVEQNVSEALRIVDYIYLLAQGEVQFAGTPAELREEEELLEVYLGIV